MNDLPSRAVQAPNRTAHASDDAYDDTYAWVGYESAQPLSFCGADQEAWADAAGHRPD